MNALVYGATGYTGRLVLEECRRRGLRPVIAGRDAEAVAKLADAHGLEGRSAPLDDVQALRRALDGIEAVLHCAGPFSRTSAPMVDACLAAGAHYLDITGEIAVFEACAARDREARARGAVLLPGVGFDVVPSDCLAAHLHRRLPTATRLVLAFTGGTGVSRGTARTMAENAGGGGAIRRGGRIVRVPSAWRTRTIDFGDRARFTMTIPWGDVSTAFHSTGIPDIEVFTAASPGTARLLRLADLARPALQSRPVQRWLAGRIGRGPAGPSPEQRARARARLWGEAVDGRGGRVVSRLVTPDGYTLTAAAAVESLRRVLESAPPAGFQTPSRAFGADFILGFDGTERVDLP